MLLDWIISHKANDLKEFLLLAKELEELRFNRFSAWYYPTDKIERFESRNEAEKFASILNRCRQHTTGTLADRYGVQYIRALMSLEKYDECIDFYNRNMSKLADRNLMKQMAKGYIAGCHLRIGNKKIANQMFAEVGDLNSITDDKKSHLITLVRNNPESDVVKSRVNKWMGSVGRDDKLIFIEAADAALESPHIVHRGDWLFLKAYIEEVYNSNHSLAISYLKHALNTSFSKDAMRHDANVMKLCLEAERGKLCGDLRNYLEAFKTDYGAFYFYIVPLLLKNGRVSEAILLTNYASVIHNAHKSQSYFYSFINDTHNRCLIGDNTYATTGFQLMLSRSAKEIIDYKRFLLSDKNIVKECIAHIRHDDDYLNEIIGTLFLREGNYIEAEKYLSQVSEGYQDKLNIKKLGYLYDNPWVNCYMPHDKWEYPSAKTDTSNDYESLADSFNPANSALLASDNNAKLNFAHEMSRLEKIMSSGTPDEKGLARIRYALARYNSFERCWALTQYWSGYANQCNYRPIYWLWNGDYRTLDYIKDLPENIPDQKWLDSQVNLAMNEMQSHEALAEAQFLLGRYRTIANKFPDSAAGKYLSTHCDSWDDWL